MLIQNFFANKKFVMFLTFIIFLLLFCNCNSVDRTNELKEKIFKIQKQANALTTKDWVKYDLEIEQTKEKLDTEREKYTPEETEKMNKLIGKYYALKATHKVKNLKDELKDATQQLEGAYEAIFKKSEEKK